jgi:hypothetical protein
MTILTIDELVKIYPALPEASSFGKPRDAFIAATSFPFLHTGEGTYDVVHTAVPAGTPMAFAGLDTPHVKTQEELFAKLKQADIYPFGHSGDFTAQDAGTLMTSFLGKSTVNNDLNPQAAIDHLKGLTPDRLGQATHDDLVTELAHGMRLFKNAAGEPQGSIEQRKDWVRSILAGLSKATRYTRLDNPVRVVTFTEDITLKDPTGAEWNATTDKVVVIEKSTDKTTGVASYGARTVDAATFDRYYQIGDGLKKARDLVRVDPNSLIEKSSRRRRPDATG